MQKELVLLRQGKPVLQKDIVKIADIMRTDKKGLPYMIYDFFQLCENKEKLESTISILLENVFENMRAEIVKQVSITLETEKLPDMIAEISGYTFLLFEDEVSEGFIVSCPLLPGCGTEGDTIEEAIENAKDAIKGYLKCARKHRVTVKQ